MDKEQGMILAKLRFDRAKELLEESKELLEKGSFKSANHCVVRYLFLCSMMSAFTFKFSFYGIKNGVILSELVDCFFTYLS